MEKKKRSLFKLGEEYLGQGASGQRASGQVMEIPMEKIQANPGQPRQTFYDEAIKELSGSIKEYGVLQPIILKDNGDGYTIIAGERRFRAAGLAGLQKIPALVKAMEPKEAALVALVENLQREDLNFIEEARAYKSLMDDFGLTQVELAEKVNKKQSTISNKIRILTLPEDVQESIVKERLTERHARALLKLKEEGDRKQVIARITSNNLNVKQTEKLIEDILQKKEEAYRKRNKINYISYKIYLNTIKKAFNQVKEMEKNAKLTQEDKGDFLEVKIILPKNDRCFT